MEPIEPIEPSVLGLSPSLLGGGPVRFPQLDPGPGQKPSKVIKA